MLVRDPQLNVWLQVLCSLLKWEWYVGRWLSSVRKIMRYEDETNMFASIMIFEDFFWGFDVWWIGMKDMWLYEWWVLWSISTCQLVGFNLVYWYGKFGIWLLELIVFIFLLSSIKKSISGGLLKLYPIELPILNVYFFS